MPSPYGRAHQRRAVPAVGAALAHRVARLAPRPLRPHALAALASAGALIYAAPPKEAEVLYCQLNLMPHVLHFHLRRYIFFLKVSKPFL